MMSCIQRLSSRWSLRFLAAVVVASLPAVAQQQSAPTAEPVAIKLPAFDVVSVKRHAPGDLKGMMKSMPDGIRLVNIQLGDIIRDAYGFQFNGQIQAAPPWVRTERFDIEARVAEADLDAFHHLSLQQVRTMVQPILADRFELKVHHETRVVPVSALTIAKNGPKLTQAVPGDPYANGIKSGDGVIRPNSMAVHRDATGENQIKAQGVSIARLVEALSEGDQDRMVVDRTGLTAKYDFTLTWTPGQDSPEGQLSSSASDPTGLSIFTALKEQLGLKLEPAKIPVDTIVVDHVVMPTDN